MDSLATYPISDIYIYGQRTDNHCAEACIACVEAQAIGLEGNDNETIYWAAWLVTGSGAYMPNAGDGLRSISKDAKTICENIQAGNLVYLYFSDGNKKNHWVVAYAYTGSMSSIDYNKIMIMSPSHSGTTPTGEKLSLSEFWKKGYSWSILKHAYVRDGGYIQRVDGNTVVADGAFQNIKCENYNGTNANIACSFRYSSKSGHDCNDMGFIIATNPYMTNGVVHRESDLNASHRNSNGVFGDVQWITYDMQKWNGGLNYGTTYYIQFFVEKKSNSSGNTYLILSLPRKLENGDNLPAINDFLDTEKPTISEVWITDQDTNGYTVNCRASDNVGIAYVSFPTWTEANGQDDLASVWPSVSTPVNGVYSYRVNISDHNNESGAYITHVYAFDAAGNNTCYGTGTVVAPKTGYLDLNGYLDGVIDGGLSSYGTADVWIYENGQYVKVAEDCGDYYASWPAGTMYRIDDIKAYTGKVYQGVYSGTLEGTVVANAAVEVVLVFYTASISANPNELSLNMTDKMSGQIVVDYTYCPYKYYMFCDYDEALLMMTDCQEDQAAKKQTYTFKALKPGQANLTFRVTDQNENELARTTVTVTVVDTISPSITEAVVTDLDETGYTVKCKVTDNVGVTEVRFPTWTEENGQDDIAWNSVKEMTDGWYVYRVNVSDHNNEYGGYNTHLYAYDAAGNKAFYGLSIINVKPLLTGTVTISGTLKYNQTLTASVSNTNNTGTLSYQWMRAGVAISGATSQTYKTVEADIGKKLSCVVTSSEQLSSISGETSTTIDKANGPAAPTGYTVQKTSKAGASDGKIIMAQSGTYQYADNEGFTNAKKITGTEITGLTAGTYYVRFAGTTTTHSGAAATITVEDGGPVLDSSSPVLLGATAGSNKITISWKANELVDKYAVFRKVSGGKWTKIVETKGTANGSTAEAGQTCSYDDATAEAGVTYYYSVRGMNASGKFVTSYDTTGVSATIAKTETLDKSSPVLLGATAGDNSITVSWKANSGVDKYTIFRKVAGGSWTKVAETTGTANGNVPVAGQTCSYVDGTAQAGVTYSYSVRGMNSAGKYVTSYNTTGVSATISVAEPLDKSSPVLVGATAGANGNTLSWIANSGVDKYTIFRKVAGGRWAKYAESTGTANGTKAVAGATCNYVDASVEAGVTYCYTVRGMNAAGSFVTSYDTTGVSAVVQVPVDTSSPVLIGATAGQNTITFSWTANSGVAKYTVFRKTTGGWSKVAEVDGANGGTTLSYTDQAVTAGTTYTYTARGMDTNGKYVTSYNTTGVSATVAVQEVLDKNAPALIGANSSSAGIVVTWIANSGVDKYAIFRKTTGGWTKVDEAAGASAGSICNYIDRTAVAGTTYTYTVRGMDANGKYVTSYDTTGMSCTK